MDSGLWGDVLESITLQEQSASAAQREEEDAILDSDILDIYDKVALILSRYKSGKLPKAFKVIPTLKNWEQVLALTRPDMWTSNATMQATKIFVSAFTPKLAARFLSTVLLPKVRADFSTTGKLNPHYYQAVMLSIAKPSAFFTGLLMPLSVDEHMTQREAAIMASILKKMSIPVLYSAAALIRLLGLPFYGPRSIIMRTLIEKKYSFPQSTISSMVAFVERTSVVADNNTVLWQQLVLGFCKRYGCDLSEADKQTVAGCVKRMQHEPMTSEILFSIEKTQSILS